MRFDYGSVVPWVRRLDGALFLVGGPDSLTLRTPVETHGENLTTVARVHGRPRATGSRSSSRGTRRTSRRRSRDRPVPRARADASAGGPSGPRAARTRASGATDVLRSLTVLKALTYAPTGGIVAAPTTSLPEALGGVRNWDYRYCWIRDADLHALRAHALRATATRRPRGGTGSCAPSRATRRTSRSCTASRASGGSTETELPWLPGYEGSRPVRVGNAAAQQVQLDVYGEVHGRALLRARGRSRARTDTAWSLQTLLLDYLEGEWEREDEGIWEVRGPRRHFTHSKVMAWVAFDRAVKAVERFGRDGAARPVEADPRRDPRRGVRRRATTPSAARSSSRTAIEDLDASAARDPARRLPAAGRPARRRDGRGDRAGARARTGSSSATATTSTSGRWTACRPAKAPSCPAPSGSWTTSR